jgi:hypothetical protein
VDRFARVVLGYHGCLEPTAANLLSGRMPIAAWVPSENAWDWLGQGLYFWEHSPRRALEWAHAKARRQARRTRTRHRPSVIGAVIQLGRCFDLTNVVHTRSLAAAYAQLESLYDVRGLPLPENTGTDSDLLRRERDCLVINWCIECSENAYQTVRGAFTEGAPAYRGAKIMEQTHIQIAVRDKSCILGVFRPTL